MRADRLLSLVLLLRHRGRMTAPAIARELEVSVRTVLRDVEALSAAGIPVYAERGRDGGFALLPGFTTDLTGLTVDEATALLAASASATPDSLGMASAFASAMRKVTVALPEAQRTAAARVGERIVVSSSGWVVDHRRDEHLGVVQQAVFTDRRLRIRYRSRGAEARWRTVDPLGLVSAAAAGIWWRCIAAPNAPTASPAWNGCNRSTPRLTAHPTSTSPGSGSGAAPSSGPVWARSPPRCGSGTGAGKTSRRSRSASSRSGPPATAGGRPRRSSAGPPTPAPRCGNSATTPSCSGRPNSGSRSGRRPSASPSGTGSPARHRATAVLVAASPRSGTRGAATNASSAIWAA